MELEHERDRWVYEIKLIKPNGAVVEVYVDAKTGTIVKEKSK
ncbi:PepSY domain-containing protein [Salmonella enterica]